MDFVAQFRELKPVRVYDCTLDIGKKVNTKEKERF